MTEYSLGWLLKNDNSLSRPAVKRYGIRLLPELYAHLKPMPFKVTAQIEQDLAEDLRRVGYTITIGH